jgi:hypothetical protein
MSTPIHQLPNNSSNTAPSEEDPFVAGVIQEMENECKQPTPVAPPPPPMPQPQMYHMPMATPIQAPKPTTSSWYNETFAKRAAIVAVISFLMFYPNDLTPLFEKAPMLSKFAAYDRIIRMILLAVVLYVLFWKLNI